MAECMAACTGTGGGTSSALWSQAQLHIVPTLSMSQMPFNLITSEEISKSLLITFLMLKQEALCWFPRMAMLDPG